MSIEDSGKLLVVPSSTAEQIVLLLNMGSIYGSGHCLCVS